MIEPQCPYAQNNSVVIVTNFHQKNIHNSFSKLIPRDQRFVMELPVNNLYFLLLI